jgi:hypothetical protein
MQLKTEMQQGWEFATGIMGADIAAHMGQEYVSAVEAAIKQLEENINNHQYRNLGIGQLQGYMLEEWGAGTFNVDAVAADSADRASVLHSTLKDSVDIQLDSGETYSAKSYVTAEKPQRHRQGSARNPVMQAIMTRVDSFHQTSFLMPRRPRIVRR